jgi:hypothetical protein
MGRLETFPPKKLHTKSQVDADPSKRATDSNMMTGEEENEELGGHFILSFDLRYYGSMIKVKTTIYNSYVPINALLDLFNMLLLFHEPLMDFSCLSLQVTLLCSLQSLSR